MKPLPKLILIFIAILIVILVAVLCVYNDCAFFNLTHEEFSHFVAPVATLLSVFLLIYTLAETKRFNENQLALNEYNIYREEISQFRQELMNLRFIDDKSESYFSERMIEKLEDSNGLDYLTALSHFLNFEYNHKDANNGKKIIEIKSNFFRPLSFIYERLYNRVIEINQNKVLSKEYKDKLFKRIEGDLIAQYLALYNSKVSGIDLTKIDNNNNDISVGFRKLNDYFFENELNKLKNKKDYEEKL